MDKIVVTGGAGFIGSHLVDHLIENTSSQVVVIDNLTRGRLDNISCHLGDPRLSLFQVDIRDYDKLLSALSGAEFVFHLAGQSTVMGAVENGEYTLESNVLGTHNVLRAARDVGVKRVVFSSSREVYGQAKCLPVPEISELNPKNLYGASKVGGEACCRVFIASGLPVVILRLSNVYGPRDFGRVIPNFMDRASRGLPLILYGGRQMIDFVWIGTAVQALVRAAEAERIDGPINIGSGQGTSLVELSKRVSALFPNGPPIEFQAKRDTEVECFVADTTRMRDVLGLASNSEPLAHLAELARSELARSGEGRLSQ